NPELVSALRASEAIALRHLLEPPDNPFFARLYKQTVELRDPARSANEDLNKARVTVKIWFTLLRGENLSRLRTYGARKHGLSIKRCHRIDSWATLQNRRSPFATLFSGRFRN